MRGIFASMQLWKKFALLGLIGLVLFIVPTTLYVISAEDVIALKQQEIRGVVPARALLRSIQLMQQHRGLSAILIGGDASVSGQRQAKAQDVDQALQKLQEELAHAHARNPLIGEDITTAISAWNGLRDAIAAGQLTAPQSFSRHSDGIEKLFEVNDLILDDFQLSLDTDLDSVKLIAGGFVAFPLLTEELGKMRARGAAMLGKKAATPEDKLELMRPSQRAQERVKQASLLFRQAFTINIALKNSLGGIVEQAQQKAVDAITLADEKVLKPESLDFPSPDYFARFTEAIDAQYKVVDAVIDSLTNTLDRQTASLRRTEMLLLGGMTALALFAAWVGTMLSRSITKPISESVIMAQRVASCDLTTRAEVVGSDESAQLLRALNDMTGSLVHIVGDVRTSVEVIHVASREIATGNSDLSNRTESQASSLEETASSMEELTSTVRQNADNARQANSLVTSASELAVKGGKVVGDVVNTMSSIKESSSRIVDIISVIDGIAFQTNILALNAAVEAARAGEQGRGFAVVASEVRNLAQRSASAAKEIKELIGDSVTKVDAGGKLVDEAGATMGEIVTSVRHVADIMGEITAASQEQSVGIEEVNRAITQMDEITQQNAALVEQAAAAAESLQEQADLLAHAVSVFKIADDDGRQSTRLIQSVPVRAAAPARVMAHSRTPAVAPARPLLKPARKPLETNNGQEWEEF